MAQEATMIAFDNSNYMKNGDFIPNRFVAQCEAIYFVCNTLQRQNPENTCGLITLSNCSVLCTLTMDTAKIYKQISQINPDGEISFCTTVSIAHLALRNRQHRNQKPKILIFLGSPIENGDEELQRLARKLKKEKVTVVIVTFGESQVNEKKLAEFVNIINGKDQTTSQIITIPPGNGILEYLRINPIITGSQSRAPAQVNQFETDLNDDPDLAYALRISMEDQRASMNRKKNYMKTKPTDHLPATTDEVNLAESVADAILAHLEEPQDYKNMELQGMTEDEQLAYAINASLAAEENKDEVTKEEDQGTSSPKNEKEKESK